MWWGSSCIRMPSIGCVTGGLGLKPGMISPCELRQSAPEYLFSIEVALWSLPPLPHTGIMIKPLMRGILHMEHVVGWRSRLSQAYRHGLQWKWVQVVMKGSFAASKQNFAIPKCSPPAKLILSPWSWLHNPVSLQTFDTSDYVTDQPGRVKYCNPNSVLKFIFLITMLKLYVEGIRMSSNIGHSPTRI